jgi:hypothetical protein
MLERAMLTYLRYPVTSFSVPILGDLKRKPRLQFLDTSLLNFRAGLQSAYFGPEPLDALYSGSDWPGPLQPGCLLEGGAAV